MWEGHVIFVGSLDESFPSVAKTLSVRLLEPLRNLSERIDPFTDHKFLFALQSQNIHCPNTTEHVWKSIQQEGLTVIFQICHPNAVPDQHSDFSLKARDSSISFSLQTALKWKNRGERALTKTEDAFCH